MRVSIISTSSNTYDWEQKRSQLIIKWLDVQLEILLLQRRMVEIISCMYPGPETYFASLGLKKNLSVTCLLSCLDQERFYDPATTQLFNRVTKRSTLRYITNTMYQEGCISFQRKEQIQLLKEEKGSLLLVVRDHPVSGYLREIIAKCKKENIEIKHFRVDKAIINYPRRIKCQKKKQEKLD